MPCGPPGRWVRRQLCAVLVLMLLAVPASPSQAPCTLPHYLSLPIIHGWSSHIKQWGNVAVREYAFTRDTMNVSVDKPEPRQYFHQCHTTLGDGDTFILRELGDHGPTTYKCVRFDKWSTNVVQLFESTSRAEPAMSLCEEDQLVANPWPLVWRHLNLGYIPCPDIGGWDMQVMNSWGSSYCEYINPVPKPRFESECVLGEGMVLTFGLPLCKGDVELPTNATLFCLGQREIGGYTHVVAVDDKAWPKIMMLRYSQDNNTMNIHLMEDVVIETAEVIPETRKKSHILLKKTLYDKLCLDNHHNCLAPETCDPSNIINCRATCRNYTSCLVNKERCDFDVSTRGDWIEQSFMGSRVLSISNKTVSIEKQGSFQCLNIYSSSTSGRKPIVKILNNGCKPRYACLDAMASGPSILTYRLSMSKRWPFRDNIVRGDLCRNNNFRNGPPQTGPRFHNQFDKVLIRAPAAGRSIRRRTVLCNLPTAISFWLSASCSGTMRSCQSGHAMSLTWSSGCGRAVSRVFYRCLYQSHTRFEKYVVTERSDDPTQLHCWVRWKDPFGELPNYLMQSHAADCTNGPIDALMRVEYDSQSQDHNTDSCLDMSTPSTQAPADKVKATLSPSVYKTFINTSQSIASGSFSLTIPLSITSTTEGPESGSSPSTLGRRTPADLNGTTLSVSPKTFHLDFTKNAMTTSEATSTTAGQESGSSPSTLGRRTPADLNGTTLSVSPKTFHLDFTKNATSEATSTTAGQESGSSPSTLGRRTPADLNGTTLSVSPKTFHLDFTTNATSEATSTGSFSTTTTSEMLPSTSPTATTRHGHTKNAEVEPATTSPFLAVTTSSYQEAASTSLPEGEGASPRDASKSQHSSEKPHKEETTKPPRKEKDKTRINAFNIIPASMRSTSGSAISMQRLYMLCFVTLILNVAN